METKRNIYLIGHMGTGKTAVGRRLAALLKRPFFDADHEIERKARRRVSDIFARSGEPEFRRLERRVVAKLAKRSGAVVALGGGAVMQAEVRGIVERTGVVIRLTCGQRVLWRRLKREAAKRPLLAGGPKSLAALIKKRRRQPKGDIVVSTTRRSAAAAAKDAVKMLAR